MHLLDSNLLTKLTLTTLLLATTGCNIVDPDANTDAGEWVLIEDDAGGVDTDTDTDTGPGPADVGPGDVDMGGPEECEGGVPRNECGGCAVLNDKVGDKCVGWECGELVCSEDGNDLNCDCLLRDGCGVNEAQTQCACQPYYEPNGTTTCADIDECAQGICHPETTCTNTIGGFDCSECPAGTIDVNNDGTRCEAPFEAIEVVQQTGRHSGNTSECIEVTCPAGKIALSGGPVADAVIEVDASRSANGGNSWLVCGFSPSAAPWEAVAVCARPNVAVETVETIKTMNPGESLCYTTTCPDGKRVVGGGGSWGGGFRMDHNRPDPTGTGWTFCGIAGSNGGDIRVTAMCADVPTTIRQNRVPNGVFGTGCIQQGCESGETLVGGGAFWGHSRARTKNAPAVPSNDQWELCGESTSTQDAWAIAICVASP